MNVCWWHVTPMHIVPTRLVHFSVCVILGMIEMVWHVLVSKTIYILSVWSTSLVRFDLLKHYTLNKDIADGKIAKSLTKQQDEPMKSRISKNNWNTYSNLLFVTLVVFLWTILLVYNEGNHVLTKEMNKIICCMPYTSKPRKRSTHENSENITIGTIKASHLLMYPPPWQLVTSKAYHLQNS